jgi:pimeloyl-ACP methyl ester carboxylesterase
MARHRLGDVVVLLPGILGSVLQRDGKDVWAPTPGGVLRGLWTLGRSIRDLRLDTDPPDREDLGDGVVATRLMPDVHIIPDLWGIDGYSAISAMIVSTFDVVPGRTFIEFPYDWRRDNRVAARRLAAVALPALHEQRSDNPDAKLILIGHSMGGLVARYFLECLDGWKDTRMLITFGTPYRGSLNALNFLANGFVKKIGPLKVADLSTLLRSFTSVYQLLPIYPCVDTGTGTLTRVAETQNLPSEVDIARAHAAEHEFHRAMEAAVSARGQEQQPYLIHPIVGLTQPTLQSARLAGDRLEMLHTYEGDDLDGDGTVPRISATPLEYDGRRPDPGVYAPERHASLQNALSVQTQLLGLLTPVERPDRFRDARGGLRLTLDDLHGAGEEIGVTVTAGVRRATLVGTVVEVDTGRPVAGPLPLRVADDQLTHTVELEPLPAGCYRLTIVSVGENAGMVQPVHGLFVVADDDEPAALPG